MLKTMMERKWEISIQRTQLLYPPYETTLTNTDIKAGAWKELRKCRAFCRNFTRESWGLEPIPAWMNQMAKDLQLLPHAQDRFFIEGVSSIRNAFSLHKKWLNCAQALTLTYDPTIPKLELLRLLKEMHVETLGERVLKESDPIIQEAAALKPTWGKRIKYRRGQLGQQLLWPDDSPPESPPIFGRH